MARAVALPGGMYRGKRAKHPCPDTVLRAKKKLKYRTVGVKVRPGIDAKLAAARVECAKEIVRKAPQQQQNADVDEKWFV
eukprot:COSAG05_NODE_14119_length_407_cov_1.025974_1_plen_79_part_10